MTPDQPLTLAQRISLELATISTEQHALARRRAILQDALLRLRTGQPVEAVEALMRVDLLGAQSLAPQRSEPPCCSARADDSEAPHSPWCRRRVT